MQELAHHLYLQRMDVNMKQKNPDKKAIRQFKVDGEVFPKGHDPERCDWLLLDDN